MSGKKKFKISGKTGGRNSMGKENKIAVEILNAKKRVENRAEAKNLCDDCKYNTGYYHHCSECDGRSKYISHN